MVNPPEFTEKDLSEVADSFGRILTHTIGRSKCDLLLQCCKTKYPEKQVKQVVNKSADVLVALESQYPSYQADLSIRTGSRSRPYCLTAPRLCVSLNYWPTWTIG